MLFIILHLGIYLRHCGKCLIFFTQMQRLERFLRQVHLLPIEGLKTLKSFLVKPIYPLERTVGSSKCGSKRCQVCLYVSETDIFESIQTKHHCKINHHLDCNDKYLI